MKMQRHLCPRFEIRIENRCSFFTWMIPCSTEIVPRKKALSSVGAAGKQNSDQQYIESELFHDTLSPFEKVEEQANIISPIPM